MSTVIRGIDDATEVLRLLDDFGDNENDLLQSEDDLDLDLDGDLESYSELPVRVNQNESVCQSRIHIMASWVQVPHQIHPDHLLRSLNHHKAQSKVCDKIF